MTGSISGCLGYGIRIPINISAGHNVSDNRRSIGEEIQQTRLECKKMGARCFKTGVYNFYITQVQHKNTQTKHCCIYTEQRRVKLKLFNV